jgi:hypothetical protein
VEGSVSRGLRQQQGDLAQQPQIQAGGGQPLTHTGTLLLRIQTTHITQKDPPCGCKKINKMLICLAASRKKI